MQNYNLTYKPFGNKAVLIEWPAEVNENILNDIVSYKRYIQKYFQTTELVVAYHSLTVIFNEEINFKIIEKNLKDIYKLNIETIVLDRKLWKIPVLYGDTLGLDMQQFAMEKGLSEEAVIDLHQEALYTVYAIGFLPGFLYLGGLDEKLHHPRRREPRLEIPQGSVGIGGKQTGIYPQISPGGWNIIGNTPVRLFDIANPEVCPVSVGDKVRFYAVNRYEYELIAIQVITGVYQFEKEDYYD